MSKAITARGKLVERYNRLQGAIEQIEYGAQSATISEGGGSKSYNRANLSLLYAERSRVNRAIRKIDGNYRVIKRVGIQTK